MPGLSIRGIDTREVTKDHLAIKFPWIAEPIRRAERYDEDELIRRANIYFRHCADNGEQPRLTGLALALNLPGPAAITRLAMRNPEWRHVISQCMTAVAFGYESMIQAGVNPSGAIFMLKQIPEFDPEEPAGSKPLQYFTDKREVLLEARVYGAVELNTEGGKLTPREAYLKIIHGEVSEAELVQEETILSGVPSSLEDILYEEERAEGAGFERSV